MENLLNVGDKLTIPTGCKAVIKDNQIVIEEKFKEGDILISNLADNAFIFKSYDDESFKTFSIYYGNNYKSAWNTLNFRHATEEEKQSLLSKLREQGLWWNSETKKLEKFRRRAKKGEKYLSINSAGYVKESVEDYCDWNDEEFDSGNYFLLDERDKAEETAKIIRETYNKRFKHGEERKLFG